MNNFEIAENVLELGTQIDAACDGKDEKKLKELARRCRECMQLATEIDRVYLRYFEANCHSGIFAINSSEADYVWKWEQPDAINAILALRHAINEPAFDRIHAIYRHRVRSNLASRLNVLGRPVAAIEQWDAVVSEYPKFAMAQGGRASGMVSYASLLYDQGHRQVFYDCARSALSDATNNTAEWDEGEQDHYRDGFMHNKTRIEEFLKESEFDHKLVLQERSLGRSSREQEYRRWCLGNSLFLNPLNDVLNLSVAARDWLHLPNHRYKVGEGQCFVEYYNIMKQEYVYSRYSLYNALRGTISSFVNREVRLFDIAEGSVFGPNVEELKLAFRLAYSIFDKIGFFLNQYFNIGHQQHRINFRRVWCERKTGHHRYQLSNVILNQQNLPLRGLYFLSKDLFDDQFSDYSEPDASKLSDLRNQIEHRFLSFKYFDNSMYEASLNGTICMDKFKNSTLRLIKLAREALIYLALAMHCEENKRNTENENNNILSVESRIFASCDFL